MTPQFCITATPRIVPGQCRTGFTLLKTGIHDRRTADCTLACRDGIHAAQVLRVFPGRRSWSTEGRASSPQRDGPVVNPDLGKDDAALDFHAASVRGAGPASYDDLLRAAGLPHHFPEKQGTEIVRENVDDHAVFKCGDELFKKRNMPKRRRCHDDQPGTLHRFGNVGGDHVHLGQAGSLETMEVQLVAKKLDPLLHSEESFLRERFQITNPDLRPRERAVPCRRLCNCTCTQYCNRLILQVTHVNHATCHSLCIGFPARF